MLLETGAHEVLLLLEDADQLAAKVADALDVLDEHGLLDGGEL